MKLCWAILGVWLAMSLIHHLVTPTLLTEDPHQDRSEATRSRDTLETRNGCEAARTSNGQDVAG